MGKVNRKKQFPDDSGATSGSVPPDKPALRKVSPAENSAFDITNVLDSLPYYVLLVDASHHIYYANKATRAALGRTAEELRGSYCPQVVHGLDHPYPGCPLEAAVRGIEYEREYFDEEHGRWSLLSAYPTGAYTSEGNELFFHSVQDITDKKSAIEEKLASEQKYRDLFNGSIDMIFIMDFRGKILDLNPAGLAFLGLSSIEDLDHFDLFRDLRIDRDTWRRLSRELETRGFVEDYEIELPGKDDAPSMVSLTANAIRDENGRISLIRGIARDHTRQRQLEQELVQAQKLESVGRLAGGVAHDFNNSLTAIQGAVYLALDQVADGEQCRELLEEALVSCAHAAGVAGELLLFSRHESVELKTLNINEAVQEILAMANRVVGATVPVITRLAENPWPVKADKGHLGQVIMNLVINARDAIADDIGRITLSTENIEVTSKHQTTHPRAHPGRFVQLTVADNGCGIDQQTLAKIFDPFFTTKEPSHGTGLGLSVVHGIVNQHKGWIEVESHPGQGTTFRLYLPAMDEEPVAESRVTVSKASIMGSTGKKILIVDDETAVRNIARRIFEHCGHTVTAVAGANEAMAVFDRENGDFDLAFCDVVLPDMRGDDLAAILLEKNPDLQILLTSGTFDSVDASDPGGERFPTLAKPYTVDALTARLRELLG